METKSWVDLAQQLYLALVFVSYKYTCLLTDVVLFRVAESDGQFGAQSGRAQRDRHVTDRMLRLHRLLVSQPGLLLSQLCRLHH